jgi:diaminohydroxyphosphoribosylaminopyrimidine deaminase/5-amino-6-(5-phosphoribosylamino)uracil reductase
MIQAEHFMELALAEARRGLGGTGPNPLVGAVIHRDGLVLATGYHARVGGPHAEVDALSKLSPEGARGATLVVTLEPCSHHGRTPPCAEAIIKAGLARVVVGMLDPNPLVAGKGVALLRQAGVEVQEPCLPEACAALNEPYLKYITTGRPWVTLKLASSLDGKLATGCGDSRWVSGEDAALTVHRLRAQADAVLVGSGTLLQDNPSLDCRLVPHRKKLLRAALDTRLALPLTHRLANPGDGGPVVLFHGPGTDLEKRGALEAKGVACVETPLAAGHLNLESVLAELGRREVSRLLVEGGGGLAAGLLGASLVDEIYWFVAPKLVGSEGICSVGSLRLERMSQALQLEFRSVERQGVDLLIIARPLRA